MKNKTEKSGWKRDRMSSSPLPDGLSLLLSGRQRTTFLQMPCNWQALPDPEKNPLSLTVSELSSPEQN